MVAVAIRRSLTGIYSLLTQDGDLFGMPLATAHPGGGWWENVALWGLVAGVVTTLLTVGAGLRQSALQRAAGRRELLAKQYGDALADALAWAEIPWRIARRTSDESATVATLVEHIHGLQERIEHHRRWLVVESEDVGRAYGSLVDALKAAVKPHAQEAWGRQAASHPSQQVFAEDNADRETAVNYTVDLQTECDHYVEVARSHISASTRVRWLRAPDAVAKRRNR